MWLGATDLIREGSWVWQSTDNDVEYDRFQAGEPNGGINENCMMMWYENGNWVDGVCQQSLNFHICELPASKPKPPVIKEGDFLTRQDLFMIFVLRKHLIFI